jgi:hypothetical protein
MYRVLAAAAIGFGAIASSGAAVADCSSEVALAVQAQGKQKFLRKETNAVSDTGPFKMVVEYQTPDRMRQIVTPLTENKPVEAIVVGDKAWTNNGEGWTEAPAAETQQLTLFMIKSSSQMYQEVGKFECLGAETVDGKQLRVYRGINEDEVETPDGKKKSGTATKNEAVRLVYLDPESGLPVRSVFAHKDMSDRPIFKELYTYPADIKIEPPKEVKK